MAKITELTALSAVPATGDLVAIVDVSDTTDSASGTTKRVTRQNLLGYTEYVALLTQTSTNAPTAVEIKNDTGATVAYGYVGVGIYSVTFTSDVLIANKTVAILVPNNYARQFSAVVQNTTLVNVYTSSGLGVVTDAILSSTPVIIRIYV